MTRDFRFKRFTVRQQNSAWKVGTDGVLLGAWATIPPDARRILDIGTGTGLIAMMLAQRTAALPLPGPHIDAIEYDPASAAEAAGNFAASPWPTRLTLHQTAFQEYTPPCLPPSPASASSPFPPTFDPAAPESVPIPLYDLILSNPPFFSASLLPPDTRRAAARHNLSLTLDELITGSASMLAPGGILALVLPADREQEACVLAHNTGLALCRATEVYPKPGKPALRILLEFTRPPGSAPGPLSLSAQPSPAPPRTTLLIEDSNGFTPQYKELTADFYLKF